MKFKTVMKIGQVLGAGMMVVGVASCSMGHIEVTPAWFLAGGFTYGCCRLATWFREDAQ